MQGHFKRTQVAVVDAPQRRGHVAAFFQLGRIVQFQQYGHAQFVGNGFKTLKLPGFQCGGNQENRIRTPRARLIDLVFVDDEIFTQDRQRHGRTRLFQILGRALEIRFVRQHGQTGRAGFFIGNGDFGRMKIRTDQAFARAGFFDFGNNGRQILRVFFTDRADKAANRRSSLRLGFDVFQGNGGFLGGYFFCFGGKDFVENIGHGVFLLELIFGFESCNMLPQIRFQTA